MTDLRARLVDALDKAGWDISAADIVDVLLSLDGIAVVATDTLAQEIWQAHAVVVGRALPVGVADEMAALLAAANTAEEMK